MPMLIALFLLLLFTGPGRADPVSPFFDCEAAITAAEQPPKTERVAAIPDKLMPAISRVESGRLDPATKRVRAWPWTINVEGVGSFFDTKESALVAVRALQARGVKSIDVGCMQVNLMHHPRAFATLDEAFDPPANARYAALFLRTLFRQTGNWNLATANYHSADADRGEDYQRRVFGRVMTPMGGSGLGSKVIKLSGPYAAWPPSRTQYAALPPVEFAFGAFAPAAAGPGGRMAVQLPPLLPRR